MQNKNILFFGDSLTAGYGLPAAASFPALIQQKLDAAQRPYKALNYGVSGETSAGGLARLPAVLARQPADVFVLALGANDGLRSIPASDTARNLHAILAAVRQQFPAARLVVAGLEFSFDLGPLGGPRLGQYAADFKALFRPLAQQNGAAFVPFLLHGVLGRRDLNLADGVHPNAAGQKFWPITCGRCWRGCYEALICFPNAAAGAQGTELFAPFPGPQQSAAIRGAPKADKSGFQVSVPAKPRPRPLPLPKREGCQYLLLGNR